MGSNYGTIIMRPFKELECSDTAIISNGIYEFLETHTPLLTNGATGWQFIDHRALLNAVPALFKFFYLNKLIANSASVVILTEDNQLPLHIDELPVVAKINFPVLNTAGWSTRWYSISDEDLASCQTQPNQFGALVEDLKSVPKSSLKFLCEVNDLSQPIVFNSRIPHEVVRINGTSPRIIASFTFFNEPRHLL